jgi:hypothetical protein
MVNFYGFGKQQACPALYHSLLDKNDINHGMYLSKNSQFSAQDFS